MSQYRQALVEAIKFAVCVFVYIGLQRVAPDANGFQWEAVEAVVVALISGLVCYIVLDVALGRARIQATWELGGRPSVDRTSELLLSRGATTMRCRFYGERDGLLLRVAHRLFKSPPLAIEVLFRPADTLEYRKQAPAAKAAMLANRLVLKLDEGVYEGELGWADLTAHRTDATDGENRVKVSARLTTSSRLRILLPFLASTDAGLDHLVLRSNDRGSLH